MSLSPLMSDYWDATGGSLSLFDGILPPLVDSSVFSCDINGIAAFTQGSHLDDDTCPKLKFPLPITSEYFLNVEPDIRDTLGTNEETTVQDILESLTTEQSSLAPECSIDGQNWSQHDAKNSLLQLEDELLTIPNGLIGVDPSISTVSPSESPNLYNDLTSLVSPTYLNTPLSHLSQCVNNVAQSVASSSGVSSGVEVSSDSTEQYILNCLSFPESEPVAAQDMDFELDLLPSDILCAAITDDPLPEVSSECVDVVLSPSLTPMSPLTRTSSALKSILLSAQPTVHTTTLSELDGESDCYPESPYPAKKCRKRAAHHNKFNSDRLVDKKIRKKQQNKEAATRYREKKRQESGFAEQEFKNLEHRNKQLKNKVDDIGMEIAYLKNLLLDVRKAQKGTK